MSLFLINASCPGQYDRTARLTAKGDTSCDGYYLALAKDDILHGNAVLITKAGCWVTAVKSQYEFEKRYGVRYKLPGCILPDREVCLISYNEAVFHHLDSLYGGKWRRQVRADVLGYRRRFLIFK